MEAGRKFKEYGDEYYPIVFDGGYSRMLLTVYYLESVYGRPWVEDGELQYSEKEVAEALTFITELEEGHVIPTLAVTNGDMVDSTDKNPKWIDGKYAGVYSWDNTIIKMEDAIRECKCPKPGAGCRRFPQIRRLSGRIYKGFYGICDSCYL